MLGWISSLKSNIFDAFFSYHHFLTCSVLLSSNYRKHQFSYKINLLIIKKKKYRHYQGAYRVYFEDSIRINCEARQETETHHQWESCNFHSLSCSCSLQSSCQRICITDLLIPDWKVCLKKSWNFRSKCPFAFMRHINYNFRLTCLLNSDVFNC